MICYKTRLEQELKYHTRYMDTEDTGCFYLKVGEAYAFYEKHRKGRINEDYLYEGKDKVMYMFLKFPEKNWGSSVVYKAVGYIFGHIEELKDPPKVDDTTNAVIEEYLDNLKVVPHERVKKKVKRPTVVESREGGESRLKADRMFDDIMSTPSL